MNKQDREVVKDLLQYMTERGLTGSSQFDAALKHFEVTTVVIHPVREGNFLRKEEIYSMDVYSPETIDKNPYGVRYEYKSREEALAAIERFKAK